MTEHAAIVENVASRRGDAQNVSAIAAALANACCIGDKTLVRLQGRTPLWLACDAGHADEVQVLLRAGADVNAKSFPHEKYQVLMGVSKPSTPLTHPMSGDSYTLHLGSALFLDTCPILCMLHCRLIVQLVWRDMCF